MIQIAEETRTSLGAPHEFYKRWIDHSTWPDWSPDSQWARLVGPLEVGAVGTLKPKGGPKVHFQISELVEDRVYTDVSSMPGARLTFRHAAEPKDGGSVLTVQVWAAGPLAWLWTKTALRGLRSSVPKDLDRLISIVEGR